MNKVSKFHSPDGPAFNVGECWVAGNHTVAIVGTQRYGDGKWDVDVCYRCGEGKQYSKDAWNFQVRYQHVADFYATK